MTKGKNDLSKNELNPGGVENLARAMIARALKDYVNGPEKMKEEAGRFLRSDFARLIGDNYGFNPDYLADKAEIYRKDHWK